MICQKDNIGHQAHNDVAGIFNMIRFFIIIWYHDFDGRIH